MLICTINNKFALKQTELTNYLTNSKLMKKFTLMLLATFFAVVGYAQKPLAKAEMFAKTTKELRQTQIQARGVSRSSTTTRQKAPRKSLGLVTPPTDATPETYNTTRGALMVYDSNSSFFDSETKSIQVIVDGTDIYIAGLAYWAKNAWIKGTIDGTTATFPASQQVDESDAPEWISGSDDGQTICDVVFNFDQEAGVLECTTTFIGECAYEDKFQIYAYWEQPTFTRKGPVVAPTGLETEKYVMTYSDFYGENRSVSVKVGFDGNDVYFQGLNSVLPEAWVKGTLADGLVTLAGGQYFGAYGSQEMYFMEEDYQFTYDAKNNKFVGEGLLYTYTGSSNVDYYRNPVIKKVSEQAAMPANPEITGLTDSDYGYLVEFNIPLIDVNGDPLVDSKLWYVIYTDTKGKIAPLTFTPATHSRLTEDMTEIPYGFTEEYDFFSAYIFLNDLYSADWNRIGIQSIYRGGGEENATEIQWYELKAISKNEWVAAEQGYENAQDVSDIEINETVAGKFEAGSNTSNSPKYYDIGSAVRMYSGNTLTITSDKPMTKIEITMADNASAAQTWLKADQEEYTYSSEDKVGTWTGEATQVVFTVPSKEEAGISGAPQARIAKITIHLGDELVELPEEYTMFYENKDGKTLAKTVNVVVDGNDVYFQGLSQYIPEAWVKGTKDGNTVTFPPMQYIGEYSGSELYAFYGTDDVVFTYDAEADTYTAEGEIFGLLGDRYYDGRYFNPVIMKVADKAAMPAAPEITNMENGSYGWYIDFNVPAVDVNSEALAIGKLSYMIYTDTEGTIAPLTFTPTTHSRLTEDMTEIPYGFTENYDFYTDEIYLNDLYSANWTRIGIQSIYRGGGEENKTEIQWFDILPEPEAIEAPEGLVTETYTLKANEWVKESAYTYQMQVGFDGNDVYFKGVSDNTANMWLKGTLSADGKTVTIPANQYMGQIDIHGYFFDFFFSAIGEDNETLVDIVLNYDAELGTFTTDQTLVLHDGKRSLGEPYQMFTDVVITKILNFAATPADPSIDDYELEGVSFPYIGFNIPTKDIDDNDIISSKLFYTVWIDEDGEEKPFVVLANEYRYITEDLTEIPYDWDDRYDIYKGGSKFYINPKDVIPSWKSIGIQSIYYGGGERNTSNIVWMDNPVYKPVEKAYALYVGNNVQVTSNNLGDILGDGGSLTYDNKTKTLTINDN